jgi:diguanylate cyclase (GGDEF)-like protein/PAS domain S-box-containing protein
MKTNRIYFSPRWKNMLGYEEDEIGSDPQEWFSRVHPQDIDRLRQALSAHLRGVTPHFESEYRILHKNKAYRWMLSRGIAVRGADGSAGRIAGSQTDITERKEVEARLLHDAFTDGLTHLPNRASIQERLNRAIENSRAGKGHLFAVLYLDLDRFKDINDSLGHPAGDELLIAVTGMLQSQLRETDIVARLGGDEFVILLEKIRDPDYAISVSKRIIEMLSRPIYLEKYQAYVSTSASIGIVLSSLGYSQAEDILRDADIAMYAAKASGKGTYEVFDPAMREHILRRVALESDLQQALEKNQLQVFYQPILSLSSGQLIGFEALVHWHHPVYGLLPASEFIPLAQEAGLIIPIDWWVFEEACRQMREWQAQYRFTPPLQINVNLTSSLLARPNLVNNIQQILRKTGLSANTMNLEVTESIVSANHELVVRIIQALQEMGVRVEIDNFGTGVSSLLNLKRFPFSAVKIDRAYIQLIDQDESGAQLVRTIVELAHKLGMHATAEGVENEGQLQQLRSMGCDFGQGFLFAASQAPAAIIGMLEKRERGESLLQPVS